MPLTIDHRLVALIGLGGVLLNLLGSLYLAYDLLGGPAGPLRTLTEVITYVLVSLAVSVGSYLVLFEIVSQLHFRIETSLGREATFAAVLGLGIGAGLTAGLGYSISLRARRRYTAPHKPAPYGRRVTYAVIIGVVTGLFGIGIYFAAALTPGALHTVATVFIMALLYNSANGLTFGVLVARLLVRSTTDLHPLEMPTFDWRNLPIGLIAGLVIGVFVGFGYWIFFGPDLAIGLGGLIGAILGGIGLGVVVGSAGQVEWWIDHLPIRRMGTFGIVLILGGLAIETFQYFISLFGITVR
jgi:hypothetical protein